MICNQLLEDGSMVRLNVEEDLTILKQYGVTPVITILGIEGSGYLRCSCDRSNLIGNYNPNLYVSLAIRCSACQQITITPKLPMGEVLPNGAGLVVAGPGEFHISPGMLLSYNNKVLTTSLVVEKEQDSFRPIFEESKSNSLEYIVENSHKIYNEITKSQLDRHTEIVRKRQKQNKSPDKDYPLIWALEKVRNTNLLFISYQNNTNDTLVALSLIVSFHDSITRWKSHCFFEKIGLEFRSAGQFYHNVFQLVAATLLVRSGNRVALTAPDNSGHARRTPDMYVRYMETGKFHLEVKAPESLQWGNHNSLDNELIYKILRAIINKSQINRNNKGIPILVVNRFEKQGEVYNAVTQALGRLGQGKESLAGIILIQSNLPVISRQPGDVVKVDNLSVRTDIIVNDHFSGRNPLLNSGRQLEN